MPPKAPPSRIVLLECSVKSRCRSDEQESQIGGRRAGDLEDVMICNVDLKIFAGRTISSRFEPSAS